MLAKHFILINSFNPQMCLFWKLLLSKIKGFQKMFKIMFQFMGSNQRLILETIKSELPHH